MFYESYSRINFYSFSYAMLIYVPTDDVYKYKQS